MSTIAEFRLPAEDSVLATAFDRVPDATFELESSVSKTLPCLWVADVDRGTIEAAFDADDSVQSYELLVETDDRLLYDVAFVDAVAELFDVLLANGGSLLEVGGANGWWEVRMRFRTRDDLVRTHDALVERGVRADLRRVTEVNAVSSDQAGLTPEQREALAAAFEEGYFEIPRRISMEELADELDISHQALSERLRRAYETLVDAELHPTPERVPSE